MSQKSWRPGRTLRRNSWLFSKRPIISWFATQKCWTEQKCIEMVKLAEEDYTYRLSKEEFRRYQGQWYLTLNKSGKNAPVRLRPIFELQSQSKTVSTRNQAKNVQNPILSNNVKDGTLLPQVILVGTGTRPKAGGGHECNFFVNCLLQQVWFTADSNLLQPTGVCVDSTLHTSFFLCTMRVLNNVLHSTLAPVSARARFTSSTWSSMSCAWVSVLLLSVPHLAFFRVFLLSLLLFYLNLELNLFLHVVVIGAKIPLALRQMRSLAPWPKTHLSKKKQTDGKAWTDWRPVLWPNQKIPCLWWARWKYRRVIIDITQCVVVASLETDAFMSIVTYFDNLMVRSNLSSRSRKECTQGVSCCSERKKKKRPRSKVVCLKKQIQWILFTGKLKNWDWTLRQETPEMLRMHVVQNWIRERKGQSGGIIQKGEPHERNLCAQFLERNTWGTSLQTDCTSKVAWKASSSWTSTYVLFSLWRRQRHRSVNVYCVFGSFNAQYWAKRIEVRYNGYFEKVQNPLSDLPQPGVVQINELAPVFVHDLDLFATVQKLHETPTILLHHQLFLKRGCSCGWKTARTLRLTENGKTITRTVDNSLLLVVSKLSSHASSISSPTLRTKDQSD